MAFGHCYAMWPFIATLFMIFINNKKFLKNKKGQNQNKGERERDILFYFFL
jgi:hypothetical protein